MTIRLAVETTPTASGKPANGKPAKYDLEDVRLVADGRWVEILSSLCGIPRESLDGRHHACPRCGGTDRFRLIDAHRGAAFCNQCFSTKCGDGFAAVREFRGLDFPSALRLVAEHVGAAPFKPNKGKPFDEQVRFDDEPHRGWVETWAKNKPGVSVDAAFRAGVKTGFWMPRPGERFSVVLFPARHEAEGPVVGWISYRIDGEPFPAISGGKASKDRMLSGSTDGWVFVGTKEDFLAAHTLVKVEGATDATAFASTVPPGHLVITNIAGAKSAKMPVEIAAGKRVILIGDADEPGQQGVLRLAKRLLPVASEVLTASLPYPVTKTKGKDVRDYVAAGGSAAKLLELAEAFTAGNVEPEKDRASVADPMEEARGLAKEWSTESGDLTLRYHKDEWFRWQEGKYWKWPECDIRASVVSWLDRTYFGINRSIIGNIIECLRAESIVRGMIEMPCWLGDGPAKPHLLSVENGVLHVDKAAEQRSDALQPATPLWFSEVRLPFPYDPAADCPLWRKTLAINVDGDADRYDLIQEWFGYCLRPSTGLQKFLMLYGEGGTGKSSTLAGLIALLGTENVSSIALERFGDQFALWGMRGRLANIAAEIGEVDKVAEGQLKALTSGDLVEFERKYKDSVFAHPTARLVFSTNNLPRFADRSGGLWRRMILCPFDHVIPPEDRIVGLDQPGFWREKGELPGILNWALEGLRRLDREKRFTEPQTCKTALDEYRSESNPAKLFLLEQYRFDEYGREDKSAVYAHYQTWCQASGYRPLSDAHFAKEVFRTFPKVKADRNRADGSRVRFYGGLTKGGA